jgi:hypothetical protein
VAELDCWVEVQIGKGGDIFLRRAVSICIGLATVKSCAYYGSLVRQMSALGEVKEQVYISRGAPSRELKKSLFNLPGISLEPQFSL